MSEEREKKRKKPHASGEPEPAPARDTQDMKAGELLRHVRTEKGMELEEVSSAIHVRVVQLRAIEEGHIESLPGMTYALGFVKSYATFLKLDPAAVANKFRTEHSVAPAKPDLKFPEPLAESKMPDPVMIGAAVFGVIAVLGAWIFFSGGEEKATTVASSIPSPPSGEIAPLTVPTTPPTPAATEAAAVPAPAAPAAPAATPPAATTPSATPSTAAAVTPAIPSTPMMMPASAPATSPAAAPAAPVKTTTPETAAADTSATLPRQRPAPEQQRTVMQQPLSPPQQETINIRPGRGRVMLQATQSSWVQVTDSSGAVVLKKVLRPGDRYYVPDQPGLSMVTSNAGGLDIYVDGQSVPQVGHDGEIVRGVPLSPDTLKRNRSRVRLHD